MPGIGGHHGSGRQKVCNDEECNNGNRNLNSSISVDLPRLLEIYYSLFLRKLCSELSVVRGCKKDADQKGFVTISMDCIELVWAL